jgi:HSP20 family protein
MASQSAGGALMPRPWANAVCGHRARQLPFCSKDAVLFGEPTMSNLARLNPLSELRDPFSDDFFKGFALRPVYRWMEGEPQMRLDLSEDEKNFFVKAEIPGVKKEDIKVSVVGNQVSLSAEVKKETEEKQGSKLIRSERYHGSVSRSFMLGESVDASAAQAKYEDGVLQLTLPKKHNGPSHWLKIT